MKYILTLALLATFTATFSQSRVNTTKQKDNSFQSLKTISIGKVYNLDKVDEKETTNTAILKRIEYKVYATKKGKLYIKLVSAKTGKEYKRYLKD